MCVVTLQEEMLVEGTGRLSANTCTEAIVEVAREGADDWTYVKLAGFPGLGCLDEILKKCLDHKQRDTHVLGFGHCRHEVTQATLLLGQFDGTVLIPEFLILVTRICHTFCLCLALEQVLVQRFKTVVGKARVAYYQQALAQERHLRPHVIGGQSPLFVRQLAINLIDVQRTDKVHIALFRNGKMALLDVKRRVGQDIDVSVETDVLRIVGCELQMVA